MTTKLRKAAADAVRQWCKKTGKPATSVRHVHPRAYVVGKAAPLCLIVAVPWQDSEPQCQDFDRRNPIRMIWKFDDSLQAGMWCATAYVVTGTCGENVAVPIGAEA